MLLGKAACCHGAVGDGTPFTSVTVDDIAAELARYGYDPHGREEMLCGATGEVLASRVFLTPVCYQRLKHMSVDKAHARGAHGPVQVLTRQPTEGKSRDGGLRFGEMERDCLDEETHQILTAEGFLFLHELEERRRAGTTPLIAAFDSTHDTLVYEPMTELIVNPARERAWLHMECPAEAARWAAGAAEAGYRSNQLSVVVTEKHVMYVQQGTLRPRAAGGEYVAWDGSEIWGKDRRVFLHAPFRELTAREMHDAGDQSIFRFRTAPVGGVAGATAPAEMMSLLGLDTTAKLHLFLEIYGYWLGDGSLQFVAGCGSDAVVFTVVKAEDVAWLLESLPKLTRDVRVYGQEAYQKRILVMDPAWITFFHGLYRSKYALGADDAKRPSTAAKRAKKDTPSVPHPGVKSAKWFAPFVWKLPRDAARLLIRGLRRADGCWKTEKNAIFTSCERFRDELVALCLHAGYAPRFVLCYAAGTERGVNRNGRPIVAKHDNWKVSFADAAKKSTYGQPCLYGRDIRRSSATGAAGALRCRTASLSHAGLVGSGVVTQASCQSWFLPPRSWGVGQPARAAL